MKAIDLIHNCKIVETETGGTRVTLQSDVDADDYRKFKTIAEYAGGLYVNKNTGHVFKSTPETTRKTLETCAETVDNGRKLNAADFFPTPDSVGDEMMKTLELYDSGFGWDTENLNHSHTDKGFVVLEPSAGDGALIDAFLRYADSKEQGLRDNTTIIMIENDPLRTELLRLKYAELSKDRPNLKIRILEGDFMDISAETLGGPVNAVLMNPPFNDWKKHYAHAESLLAREGYIASILPDLKSTAKLTNNANAATALDMLALSSSNLALTTEVEKRRFQEHEKKRGAAIKTGIQTSIYATTKAPDTMSRRSTILDHFSITAASHQPVYNAINKLVGNLVGDANVHDCVISEDQATQLLGHAESYLKDSMKGLVINDLLPIHSSIPLDAYAANLLAIVSEDVMSPEAMTMLSGVIAKGLKGQDSAPENKIEPEIAHAPSLKQSTTPAPKPDIEQTSAQSAFPGF